MLNPTAASLLLSKVNDNFTLSMLISKRACQFMKMDDRFSKTDNPIVSAIKDFNENKLSFERHIKILSKKDKAKIVYRMSYL